MNTSLVIMEGKYVAIDTDDSSCHGYYIIKFCSYPYTLQADLIIEGKVISSDEILCEGTYFFQINIYPRYYVLQIAKSVNTVAFLRKIINGNVKLISYDLKYFFLSCLSSISQNYYNTLSYLHIPMK